MFGTKKTNIFSHVIYRASASDYYALEKPNSSHGDKIRLSAYKRKKLFNKEAFSGSAKRFGFEISTYASTNYQGSKIRDALQNLLCNKFSNEIDEEEKSRIGNALLIGSTVAMMEKGSGLLIEGYVHPACYHFFCRCLMDDYGFRFNVSGLDSTNSWILTTLAPYVGYFAHRTPAMNPDELLSDMRPIDSQGNWLC